MKFFNQNVLLNEDDEIRRFVAGYEGLLHFDSFWCCGNDCSSWESKD